MCVKTICHRCHKITYSGCGRHLSSIFRGMKKNELCHCNPIIIDYIRQHFP
jgi:hypothetical protein